MRHKKKLATLFLSIVGYTVWPAATVEPPANPWAAACRVSVNLRGGFSNGGSGTLIATDGEHALVLTVRHVAERVGQKAQCQWGNQKTSGVVAAIHPSADLALLLVKAPVGIKPVPLALPTENTDPIYLAGYPGYDREHLRYQKGDFVELDAETLTVTCRPEKGMSGGPAYDRYGRVVGAVSAYGLQYGFCGSGESLFELTKPYFRK